jgi:dTDP-glucose 4,6-dehydratase
MPRVLLTGGAGFIGSAVARTLLASGREVVVLDLLTYAGNRDNLDGLDVEFVQGDVCDEALVRTLVQDVDAVVHAAAESHVARSLTDPAPFLRTNIEGTRVVLEAAAAARVPHTVHVSTDEVFGQAEHHEIFAPTDTLRPGNVYAASKAAAEAFVHAVAHTRGYRATVVRCTNNYGPRQHSEKAIPGWIRRALAGGPLPIHGRGEAIRDWLHVEDFAAGLLAVLERGTPGDVHHFSGRTPKTNREVAERILGLCGGGPLDFQEDRPGQDKRYALDDRRTRRVLEWAPKLSFDEGLTRLVERHRELLCAPTRWPAATLAGG